MRLRSDGGVEKIRAMECGPTKFALCNDTPAVTNHDMHVLVQSTCPFISFWLLTFFDEIGKWLFKTRFTREDCSVTKTKKLFHKKNKVVQHFNITILVVTHVCDVVNRSCENLKIIIITLQSLAQRRTFPPPWVFTRDEGSVSIPTKSSRHGHTLPGQPLQPTSCSARHVL